MTMNRDEFRNTLPRPGAGCDDGCDYCGRDCVGCGIPHGYVAYIEEELRRYRIAANTLALLGNARAPGAG